jgi:hypothetical protein
MTGAFARLASAMVDGQVSGTPTEMFGVEVGWIIFHDRRGLVDHCAELRP